MNRTHRPVLPALLAGLVILASGCAAGSMRSAPVPYEWPAGTQYAYAISSTNTISMEIPGMGPISMGVNTGMDVTLSATGTLREFTITIDDISFSMDLPDMGMDLPQPDLSTIKGSTMTAQLGARGEVTDVSGIEGIPALEQMGGADGFKETLRSLFLYLPEGGLEPGATWSHEASFSMNQMGMQVQNASSKDYNCVELTEWEGVPAYRVDVSGMVTTSGGGDQGGMSMDLSAAGNSAGTTYVDPVTGALLHHEARSSMTGGVSVQGQEIPWDLSISTTITRK